MERSDEWALSADWHLEVAGHIVVRDSRVFFARRGRTDDKIVGRFEDYKFQGLIKAACRVYRFDRLDITIFHFSTPDFIPENWHDIKEDANYSLMVRIGGKYYDLVEDESVNFSIKAQCFVLRIFTPLRTIRKFVMRIG